MIEKELVKGEKINNIIKEKEEKLEEKNLKL
ncbi:hypothetical protein EZS27_016100 [termite gut metagenome]|uniref:Uncharacterized protein n=1 Tax=termite gut metagenome TaxID=433724 RepID=A0A5J4RRI8_9ZZZZ